MLVLVIGLAIGLILYKINFRSEDFNQVDLIKRYVFIRLKEKHRPKDRRNDLWINPFVKQKSDFESYYFDAETAYKHDKKQRDNLKRNWITK